MVGTNGIWMEMIAPTAGCGIPASGIQEIATFSGAEAACSCATCGMSLPSSTA
jgi:hypothetical protein